jgi:3-hydroxyacyl-[acyl-carrier-protein] dehydratase
MNRPEITSHHPPLTTEMRWIWIDRFLTFESGKAARAVKNLSLAEDYFADHFPGYPVMPGSLMLEGLAQTGGILVGEVNDFREKVVLAKILEAKFQRDVLAGETLIYDVEVLHMRPEGAAIQGRIRVVRQNEEVPVGEAQLFFAHLDQSRSKEIFGDHNFVFSGNLTQMLKLAKAAAVGTDGKSSD